jgi:conjugal transfer/entry exclusion protein
MHERTYGLLCRGNHISEPERDLQPSAYLHARLGTRALLLSQTSQGSKIRVIVSTTMYAQAINVSEKATKITEY